MNTSQRINVMSIQVTNITELDGVLSFNIKNVDFTIFFQFSKFKNSYHIDRLI